MDNLRAGMVFLINGLFMLIFVLSYSTVIVTNNIVVSKQAEILHGVGLTISIVLIISSFYFFLKKKVRAQISSLKKDILELSHEEFKVYEMIRKRASLTRIVKKTKLPKNKVKKIVHEMNEKGIIKTNKTGKLRALI